MSQATEFNWYNAMSNLSEETIDAFIKKTPLKLIDMPCITNKSVKKLNSKGVENIVNLIGQFMTMYEENRNSQENCDEFYSWLGEVGVSYHYKNSIIRLVVEKIMVLFPGIIDVDEFTE
jgi:hypothetical protein